MSPNRAALTTTRIRCAGPKETLIYRCTKNLRATQLLLGDTELKSAAKCLSIVVDDALEIPEQTEI